MPNNEDKNKEALTESQAKEIIRLLSQHNEQKSINDADRAQNEAKSRQIEADRAKLAEEQRAFNASKDAVLSDRQALVDAQQKLIADQQLVADALADVARREAAAEALLPQIAALLESNRQANAREAKRDAVIDTWGQSITSIEQNVNLLVNVPGLIKDMTGAINAGFELASKQMASDRVLADQIAAAVEAVGSRQEDIYVATTDRFNALDVQVNAVHTSVDRIGNMVTRLFDLVTNIGNMLEANNERYIKFEAEVFSLKKHVTSVANHFHKQVMTELDKFTQIPDKIDIQVKNLSSNIAKLKGEMEGFESKVSAAMDGIRLRSEAFGQQVELMNEFVGVWRENIKRGTEIEIGRLQNTFADLATQMVKSYDEVMKKSDVHDILSNLHLLMERVSLSNQEQSQIATSLADTAGEVGGSLNRVVEDLSDKAAIWSRSLLGHMNDIEDNTRRTNQVTADGLARLDMFGGKLDGISSKLLMTAGTAEGLMSLTSTQLTYLGQEFVKAVSAMCESLPDRVADKVADIVAEAENVAFSKLLGGDTPKE